MSKTIEEGELRVMLASREHKEHILLFWMPTIISNLQCWKSALRYLIRRVRISRFVGRLHMTCRQGSRMKQIGLTRWTEFLKNNRSLTLICQMIFLIRLRTCHGTKVFRRSFVEENNLKFQEIRRTNDLFFVCSALVMAKGIVTIDEHLVHYRIGATSNCQATNDQQSR